MAIQASKPMLATEEVRELVLARQKYRRDMLSRLIEAYEEGRQLGIEEARQQAYQQIAQRMQDRGYDPATIKRATGIDLSDTNSKKSCPPGPKGKRGRRRLNKTEL